MKLIIVPVEPIATRYTCEWIENLVPQVKQFAEDNGIDLHVDQLDVEYNDEGTSTGAFLNFASTNIYKSAQFIELAKKVHELNDEDVVLYTDAWNPTVIQINYMRSLMNKKFKIAGMWHAGSYDPQDFLGRQFDKKWSYSFERSLVNSFDYNFFATEFSKDLLTTTLFGYKQYVGTEHVVGWPMEYLDKLKGDYPKTDTILFPHRISSEKQPEIFKELARMLPQYEFIFAQETKLSKYEYHELLRRSKIVFSASLQETLGIGFYEGALVGAVPILPDRLSYSEMTKKMSGRDNYVYPSSWSKSFDEANFGNLADMIDYTMKNYDEIAAHMKEYLVPQLSHYFNGSQLYRTLLC